MNNIQKKIEALVDKFIAKDEQNSLFDLYTKETGKDPVPADGGHTDDFESWFVSKVGNAVVLAGCDTVESAVAFIRKTTPDISAIYKDLTFSSPEEGRDCFADAIAAFENGVDGAIPREYSRNIGYALADDIARDIHESADHSEWNYDDMRLAFGRVLCAKLGVGL